MDVETIISSHREWWILRQSYIKHFLKMMTTSSTWSVSFQAEDKMLVLSQECQTETCATLQNKKKLSKLNHTHQKASVQLQKDTI